ncbi:MAG: hypothetical protein WA970_01310 [Gammaproteobacteria bacterium]
MRLEYAGTPYHVTSRGDRRQAIYRDEIDPEAWLEGWPQSASACIGWCTPIVRWSTTTTCCLETVEGHLACGITAIGHYTQRVNRRHGLWWGHLYVGRYKAILVQKAQRRSVALSLANYRQRFSTRDEAMARAYLSGAYTMAKIGQHFGVHYMTVSRAVRKFEGSGPRH